MVTKVVIKEGNKLPKNPVIIEGFPSKGFVSTISAKYMIDRLEMEPIGYIESDKLRSVTVIHNSKAMRPVRIYAKGNLIVILSEIILPLPNVPDFSNAIIEWFRKINPDKVVLLAGISGKESEKEHEIFGLANTPELTKKLSEAKVNSVEEGMLTGISSELLLYCVENGIPSISLMAETKNLPDPLAAASMLEILTKVLDIKIDTKKLVEEGKKIEAMFNELQVQMRRGQAGYKEMENYSPMYQ